MISGTKMHNELVSCKKNTVVGVLLGADSVFQVYCASILYLDGLDTQGHFKILVRCTLCKGCPT